jgi:CTP synthase
MQLMAVEAARNQLDLDAGSAEWGSYDHEVVCEMESQKDTDRMGGTMRLGGQTAELSGQVEDIYGNGTVSERHRHRYELDPSYQSHLEDAGLVVSGINPGNQLAEFVERPDHGFFIGTQAHPEFKSSLESPSPLFSAFVEAAADGV